MREKLLMSNSFQTAYEQANDVKVAVIDLFKVATKYMVIHAPEVGYNFRLKRTVRKL